jgi:glycosyltransferase involved in cell wall biosynthesis
MTKPLALVIATYNRARRLDTLLEALAHQTLDPALWDVLVCIDGSTDNSIEIAKKHELAAKIPLKWFEQANTGQSGARNKAILATEAKHIVVIDDDMELAPDFLKAHLNEYEKNPEQAVVIGKVIPLPNWQQRPLFEAVREDYMLRLHARLENMMPEPPTAIALITQNVSFPRKMYLDVGGFDKDLRLAEDMELGLRLERAGGKFVFSKEAWAVHRSDIGGYATWAKRELAYGGYFVQIWKKYNGDPLLHPLRNYVLGSSLNRWLVNAVLPVPGGLQAAELALRVLGETLRSLRLWKLAIATHKAIEALLRHRGIMNSLGSWSELRKCAQEFRNLPERPEGPTLSGAMSRLK